MKKENKGLLEVKEVTFSGSKLIAIKTEDEKVYASVSNFCEQLGIDTASQRIKIQKHKVLKKRARVIPLPSKGGIQEALCLEVKSIALWLATISPSKIKEEMQDRFEIFLEKVESVLAKEFLDNQEQEQPKFNIPKNFAEALRLSAELAEKNEALEIENKELKPQASLLKLFTEVSELKTLKQIGYKLKKYGLGPYKIFEFLRKHHILTKVNGENYPQHQYEKHFKIETLLKKWIDKDTGEEKSKAFDILKMQPSFYKHLAELLVNDKILTINEFNSIDFNDVPNDEACFDFTQRVG